MPEARTIQIYPTTEDYQYSQDDTVPLRTAVGYLSDLLHKSAADPQVAENSARITGWLGVKIVHDRVPSSAELLAERVARTESSLAVLRSRLDSAAALGGLSAEQVAALLAEVNDLRGFDPAAVTR